MIKHIKTTLGMFYGKLQDCIKNEIHLIEKHSEVLPYKYGYNYFNNKNKKDKTAEILQMTTLK